LSQRLQHSPVLLLGAGTGEATCGILYLAGYLRRGGVEAFVRLYDEDEPPAQARRSLAALVARVRPRLVGISLKWFHHVHGALRIARTLRQIDPTIQIVVGGNTAAHFWRELHATGCFDHIVIGDGEAPLLAICRGDPSPPNCVSLGPSGIPRRLPLSYIQGPTNTADVYYSHFNDIFLSQLDANAFSGWVAPGKGCGENCLYCGGARGNQKAAFGRAKPFLRSEENVRRDHQEIASKTWQMRYDFSGSTAEFLGSTWAGVDLSQHCCTYFLWGLAKVELIDELARTFKRVFMVLDIGCFSEQQRLEQIQRGLLKPCATDRELFSLIDACRRHPNLDVEVSGIGGLPFASQQTLREELRLVEQVIAADCVIGYQRLESQPGALVTEHPERFEMVTEAKTFAEFLEYFEERKHGELSVPMIRFRDPALEREVQRTSDQVDALAWKHRDTKRHIPLSGSTRLLNTSPSTREFTLGDWLGTHRIPVKLSGEKVTVVRSVDGVGLNCAPSLDARTFSDPVLTQDEEGSILLATLAAFERPTTVAKASKDLARKARLDAGTARAVIEHLVEGRFLQPV
jgi:hypothetical protein